VALAQPGAWAETITPRAVELPPRAAWRWSTRLDGPGVRLAPIDGSLFVARGDGRLLELGDGEPAGPELAGWRALTLPAGGFRPAGAGDPVFITEAGEVGRFSPASGWRPIWRAGISGSYIDAFGLGGERILLSSSQWADGLRLLDEQAREISWSLPTHAPWLLAAGGAALGLRRGEVEVVDLAAGRSLWRHSGVDAVAAMSDAAAWIVSSAGHLVEFDLATGAGRVGVRLPGGAPSTRVAPNGHLYAVGRALEVVEVALADPGTVLARVTDGGSRPLRGVPHAVAIGGDGRLLIATAETLLLTSPGDGAELSELWHTDDLIVETHVCRGSIYVLTEEADGEAALSCLGPA
jgi:hypothetical protein